MSFSKEKAKVKEKYAIYKTDLKHKKDRNLDPDKIIWNNNLKYLYDNVDLDSLEYRLYECKRSNIITLDLNNLALTEFPNISNEYKEKIKNLFIAENSLEILPDLSDFKQLETLDISNNRLTNIIKLPLTLIELCCQSNKLSHLPSYSECPNLKRIECSKNEIKEIPSYSKLESLICNNNIIHTIGKSPLKYLNCSVNKLTKLDQYHNLVDLMCNNNNISDILIYRKLKYLEIIQTNISSIPFMENLEEVYCEKNTVKQISKRYNTESSINIQIRKGIIHIIFTKNNIKLTKL